SSRKRAQPGWACIYRAHSCVRSGEICGMRLSHTDPALLWICRQYSRPMEKRIMAQEIRLLLVDDHSLFRESLSRLLEAERDLRIAGNCASVREALSILDGERVDVVLLDYDLGEEQGAAFLEAAAKRGFEGRVLMVTAGMGDAETLRALEGGSSGIFLKHSPPTELVDAIHKVAKGEMWLDSRAVRSLVAGATGRSEAQRTSHLLSARERSVLKAVFEGFEQGNRR